MNTMLKTYLESIGFATKNAQSFIHPDAFDKKTTIPIQRKARNNKTQN